MLTQEQIQQFHQNGYLVVENVIQQDELNQLRQQLEAWVEESCQYDQAWGTTLDGRSRFDIDPADHSPEHPSLRRVSSPTEISEAY